MSSILSTQNRHIFLRRKYCFLPPNALSPPVGRCDALMGLPPRPGSGILVLLLILRLAYRSFHLRTLHFGGFRLGGGFSFRLIHFVSWSFRRGTAGSGMTDTGCSGQARRG